MKLNLHGRAVKSTTCFIFLSLGMITRVVGQVFLNDPMEFSVPTTRLDFETFPDGRFVPAFQLVSSGAWTNQGVKLGRDVFVLPLTYPLRENAVSPHSGVRAVSGNYWYFDRGGVIQIQFVQPGTITPLVMTEAGIWVQHVVPPNPSTVRPLPIVTFYSIDGELGVIVAREQDDFIGMRSPVGIARITISYSPAFHDTGYFTVDDLQFGPVPAQRVETERVRPGKIVATWPGYYGAFQLQVTHHVNKRKPHKTRWRNVEAEPVLVEGSYVVTNRLGQGRFFRIVPR